MARKKRAWNMSNPLYRYLQKKGKAGTRKKPDVYRQNFEAYKRKKTRGVRMARRFRSRSRGGIGGGSFVVDLMAGVGAAAVAKRFVGQPLGNFTGAAAGAGTAMVFKKNMLAYAAGGFIHDNIGNTGVGASTASGVLY